MNYLKNVLNVLKKCTWSKLSSSTKLTAICLALMIVGGFAYWGFDLLGQLIIKNM